MTLRVYQLLWVATGDECPGLNSGGANKYDRVVLM